MQTEIPFPAEDQFDYASEVLGKLSFQEIKLTSMPIFHGDLSSIIEAISEDVPWVSFLGDFGSLSFRKSGIEITVGERTRIVPGRDKKRLTDEALNNISKDANYLIGLVVGRLNMKPTELKPEISIVFEKPGILPRPFNEYFNQAVLSKMKVKEVPSIDLTVEDEFDGIESLITYHLSKDEENDHVMLGVEMRRFTPIALDRFSYIGVEKMNRLLESLGMKD